jgi:hypothetical protein
MLLNRAKVVLVRAIAAYSAITSFAPVKISTAAHRRRPFTRISMGSPLRRLGAQPDEVPITN